MRKTLKKISAGTVPENRDSPLFNLVVLITGAGGIIAQVILLRELLVGFYGNELTIDERKRDCG